MILTQPYVFLAAWVKRNFKFVAALALLGMALGVGADRLVGGRAAVVAGSVQFITVVIYIFLAVVLILFSPRRGRVGTVMRSTPFQIVAAVFCTACGAITVYAVVFTVKSLLKASA